MQCLRDLKSFVPIQRRAPLNQFRYVGHPGAPFPKILGAVDAEHRQQIFRWEGWDPAGRDLYLNWIPQEFIEVRRDGIVAQGELGVQLDHGAAFDVAIVIFARDQRRGSSGRKNPIELWFVAHTDDDFVRAGQIALAQNDIYVFESAQGHVAVNLRGEDRTLVRSSFDPLFAE